MMAANFRRGAFMSEPTSISSVAHVIQLAVHTTLEGRGRCVYDERQSD